MDGHWWVLLGLAADEASGGRVVRRILREGKFVRSLEVCSLGVAG